MRPNPNTADRVATRIATADRVTIRERSLAVTSDRQRRTSDQLPSSFNPFPSTCEHLRSLAVATCDCLPRRLIFPIFFFSLFYTFPICIFWFLYLRLHIFTLHYSTGRRFLPLRFAPRSHSGSSRLHSLSTCASATRGPSPVTPLLLRTRPQHCAPLTHLALPPWFCFV